MNTPSSPTILLCPRGRSSGRNNPDKIVGGTLDAIPDARLVQGRFGEDMIEAVKANRDAALVVVECPGHRRLIRGYDYSIEAFFQNWRALGVDAAGIFLVNRYHACAWDWNPWYAEEVMEARAGIPRKARRDLRLARWGAAEACGLATAYGWTPVLTSNRTLREDVCGAVEAAIQQRSFVAA